MQKQIHQKKYNKTCFVILSLILIAVSNTSFAWQHPVHRLAAESSFDSLTIKCRQKFNLNDLTYGSTESDLYRHLLINPSHKHDHWRIEKSYIAALEVAHTDPSLADRRIARAFHYIQDQSEPLDTLRKNLYDKWEMDSRNIGYAVLLRDRNRIQFVAELSRNKIKYSSYDWSEIRHEVTLINNRFSDVIKDVLRTARGRHEAYVKVRKALVDYFASTLALQNHLMHRYCVEKNDEIPDSPRYPCNIKDKSAGVGNNCQSWVKESYSRKDIIIVNEDAWIAGWREPRGYKKLRFDKCPIAMQDAQDVCTSWMNNGNSLSGRNQHGTTVNANRNQGMLYDLQQGSYGGGRFCLTAEEATKIKNDPHTVKITPVGKPCSK
jgi:hypothetical protein